MSQNSNPENSTTLKRKLSDDDNHSVTPSSNHEKLKSIWMDIVAEKADKDSEDALAMIQQLPNVLNAIDKAVEKGYITFCKDSSNSSQEEEEEPPTKAEKRIYDKVMYAPPWISKKWEISMNTDFTIRDIGVRPYPKSWFKQESEYWTKETQVALIVHNEWQSSKIMEIAPKIYDAVASFKVIIQSNRKDATEFCQNLLKMGIKVAICSSGEECEKALQSIESGLPKTRIPFSNVTPLRNVNVRQRFPTPYRGGYPPYGGYYNTPSEFSTFSLPPTTSLGSAFTFSPQPYYFGPRNSRPTYYRSR